MTDPAEFDRAVAAHDAALAGRGINIWVGNEPTFTDRTSNALEWATDALGHDKRRRAEHLLIHMIHMACERSGVAVLRTIGRQYPGETSPRWSLGLYARRDGGMLWSGPPDPLLSGPTTKTHLGALQACLEVSLASRGFRCIGFRAASDWRIVLT